VIIIFRLFEVFFSSFHTILIE